MKQQESQQSQAFRSRSRYKFVRSSTVHQMQDTWNIFRQSPQQQHWNNAVQKSWMWYTWPYNVTHKRTYWCREKPESIKWSCKKRKFFTLLPEFFIMIRNLLRCYCRNVILFRTTHLRSFWVFWWVALIRYIRKLLQLTENLISRIVHRYKWS